jgi:hypothetical protein
VDDRTEEAFQSPGEDKGVGGKQLRLLEPGWLAELICPMEIWPGYLYLDRVFDPDKHAMSLAGGRTKVKAMTAAVKDQQVREAEALAAW